MFIDGKTIAEGSITADKISGVSISADTIEVRDAFGRARVRLGNLANPCAEIALPNIDPVPRTQDEIEQWGPDGLRMRDPSEPPKTDVPLTTAEEVW